MCAPISRTSPSASNPLISRTAPATRSRSAWIARSPSDRTRVPTHSSRPPISASHSQIAACFDVLAGVHNAPAIVERDRSRSRVTRNPFAWSPAGSPHRSSASSCSCAPSNSGGSAKSHASNRSGNGMSMPLRSSRPAIFAFRIISPRGSTRSGARHRSRMCAASTVRCRKSPQLPVRAARSSVRLMPTRPRAGTRCRAFSRFRNPARHPSG
jgi:hypothetical protein